MRNFLSLIVILILSACGGGIDGGPKVSRAAMEPASGMTYDQFRGHAMNKDGDYLAAQKRFIAMDRNNDGRLSQDEVGGY